MRLVNIKDWYSTQQALDLLGFKYYVQIHRWRKQHQIRYQRLCKLTLYYREDVDNYLLYSPEVYVKRWHPIAGLYRKYNYQKLVETQQRIAATVSFDIDLTQWQPYCLLAQGPHRMILSRLSNQVAVPQVRTMAAYGITFYNVEDIEREFKWTHISG